MRDAPGTRPRRSHRGPPHRGPEHRGPSRRGPSRRGRRAGRRAVD